MPEFPRPWFQLQCGDIQFGVGLNFIVFFVSDLMLDERCVASLFPDLKYKATYKATGLFYLKKAIQN
jgi:hypothetical protein